MGDYGQGRLVVQRGEIWWASLPAPLASGPGYRRPVVVVQTDQFNESRISKIVIATITSNLRLAAAPGNVVLLPTDSGLPAESVINVSQVMTVDKSFLTDQIGALPHRAMNAVDAGLRLVLGL